MIGKIGFKEKQYLIKLFTQSAADIDSLCSELDMQNVYTGRFDGQITELIRDIERTYPNGIERLYNSLTTIFPAQLEGLSDLFEVNATITNQSQLVAVLFSDIKGYSKIKNDKLKSRICEINNEFKGKIDNDDSCLYSNTWGDAFYIVYSSPSELLSRAVELRDIFINTDWISVGFDEDLKIRIALHLVEAVKVCDSAGKVVDVTGTSIDESARIEPIVEPNKIYCSKTFYEVVKTPANNDFKHLGVRKLVKDYGELELYSIE